MNYSQGFPQDFPQPRWKRESALIQVSMEFQHRGKGGRCELEGTSRTELDKFQTGRSEKDFRAHRPARDLCLECGRRFHRLDSSCSGGGPVKDGPTVGDAYSRIYSVVKRIPRGRVATYGQVALLAGIPRRARQVGYALHVLPDDSVVPWHRVVNAGGRISLHSGPTLRAIQRHLLECEGVSFGEDGRLDLNRFQWQPDGGRTGERT